ncbi:MAG: metallophosphoesterase [Pyrinomonadaceae bacterium]
MYPTVKTLTLGTAAALAIGLLCLGYAYFIEPGRLVVNHYQLRLDNWDPAFDGFRVALISDIHAGSHYITPQKLRRIVELTNEQDVDAVFMLGDFLSQRGENGRRVVRMEPAEIARNLAGLRARFGVFAVLGNHDEWYDPAAMIAALEGDGYRVLNGEMAVIPVNNGRKLRILGLKDHTTMGIWRLYSKAAKDLAAPTEHQGPLIILQHSPDVLPAITGEMSISGDPQILFAGHTHGGQAWLPVIGSPIVPSMFGQKFARGHVKAEGLDVFVTTGIGTSILPLRFLVPPEIAVVTVRAK